MQSYYSVISKKIFFNIYIFVHFKKQLELDNMPMKWYLYIYVVIYTLQ